jgi:hypothetical protein
MTAERRSRAAKIASVVEFAGFPGPGGQFESACQFDMIAPAGRVCDIAVVDGDAAPLRGVVRCDRSAGQRPACSRKWVRTVSCGVATARGRRRRWQGGGVGERPVEGIPATVPVSRRADCCSCGQRSSMAEGLRPSLPKLCRDRGRAAEHQE